MCADEVKDLKDIKQIRKLPPMIAVETRPWDGVSLDFYIKNPTNQPLKFEAELLDGGELPSGLACQEYGVLEGTPKLGTARKEPYFILVTVQNESTWPLVFEGMLTILTAAEAAKLESGEVELGSELDQKTKAFWQQFAEGQLPSIEAILNRPTTPEEIGWLLERFATITIWNTDDAELPEQGRLITISEISDKYAIYDFNSILVATPKDLYDPNRSFADYVQTAMGLVQEIQKRGWKIIELAGFEKMKTAAWVEIQKINATRTEEEQIHVRSEESQRGVEIFLNQLNQESKLKELNLGKGE